MEGKRRAAIIRKASVVEQRRGQRADTKSEGSLSWFLSQLCRLLELFQFWAAFVFRLSPYEVCHHILLFFFGVFSGVTPNERRLEKTSFLSDFVLSLVFYLFLGTQCDSTCSCKI